MGKIGMFRPGHVEIRVCGKETERFLNLCRARKIVLYEIIREEDGSLRCVLLARDFRQLFEEQPALCLPHFSRLVETAPASMSKKPTSGPKSGFVCPSMGRM